MLGVVVVCGFRFLFALFFIPQAFSTVSIDMSSFPTVAAGFGAAVAHGRARRFAFPFRFAFPTFAFVLTSGDAFAVGPTGGRTFPTALTFFTIISPPSIIGGVRVVRDGGIG